CGDLRSRIATGPDVLPASHPATNQVVALFKLLQETGKIAGMVLEIRIHSSADTTGGLLKSRLHGCGLPEVAPQLHDPYRRKPVLEPPQYRNRVIAAAVIHKDPL